MHVIYVGDASNVAKRIRQHESGNVEASALRKHLAGAMGYKVARTRRASGSYRQRLDLPDPKVGEQRISAYIASGHWGFVLCESHEEARDLQWYLIEQLQPTLNVDAKAWTEGNERCYAALHEELVGSGARTRDELRAATGPGVYVLFHEHLPEGQGQ